MPASDTFHEGPTANPAQVIGLQVLHTGSRDVLKGVCSKCKVNLRPLQVPMAYHTTFSDSACLLAFSVLLCRGSLQDYQECWSSSRGHYIFRGLSRR